MVFARYFQQGTFPRTILSDHSQHLPFSYFKRNWSSVHEFVDSADSRKNFFYTINFFFIVFIEFRYVFKEMAALFMTAPHGYAEYCDETPARMGPIIETR